MKEINPEEIVFINIETVSGFPSYADMDLDWQELWVEKNQYLLTEEINVEALYKKRAGLMAEFGKIVCISIGYFASKESSFLQIKSFVDTDEKKVLLDFISAMNQIEAGFFTWSFAGHNIKEFHIPFICRRLLVNNIEIPAYLDFQNKKPWETMMLDSFHFWRFGDYKNYTSLKLLSKLLELPGFNDEMQGKEIGALYWVEDDIIRLENLKTISNHCSNNLVTMANVFLKYFRLPLMHREELVIDS